MKRECDYGRRRNGLVLALAVPLCVALGAANARGQEDSTAVLASGITRALGPIPIAALVNGATGRGEAASGPLQPTLEQVRRALGVEREVAIALLQIIDEPGVSADRQIRDLARITVQFRTVRSDLSALQDDRNRVAKADAALRSGHFDDAEASIRQIEEREVAAAGAASDSNAPESLSAEHHRIRAAQARTLLGKIALMRLRYADAADNFEQARRLITAERVATRQPTETDAVPPSSAAADGAVPAALQHENDTPAQPVPDASPPTPARGMSQIEVVAPPEQTKVAVAQPAPLLPAAVQEEPMAKPGSPPNQALPNVIDLLLHRGDSLLALGDVASARLLFERAAELGDARGATGVGKTYDPRVLAQIGVRGIQPDAAVAAAWYRKALDQGDAAAGARLHLLGQ